MMGCSAKSPLPFEPKAAVEQLKTLVPEGTSAAIAEATMTKSGFRCTRMVPPKSNQMLLICSIDDGRQPVKRRWLVSLEVKDEKVVGYGVTTGLVGPKKRGLTNREQAICSGPGDSLRFAFRISGAGSLIWSLSPKQK